MGLSKRTCTYFSCWEVENSDNHDIEIIKSKANSQKEVSMQWSGVGKACIKT